MRLDIYNKMCELMVLADKTAALFVRQDYFNGIKYHQKIVDILKTFLGEGATNVYGPRFIDCIGRLLDCQAAEDYVGMADCYVMQLKPLCAQIVEELRQDGIWQEVKDYYSANYEAADAVTRRMLDGIQAECEDIPAGYELVETAVGSFALKVKSHGLSSINNPYDEADRLVESYCDGQEDNLNMTVLGLGMGYLAGALSERADVLHTNVYETDRYVIKAAFHYADLQNILKDSRVSVHYDPELAEFSRELAGKKSKVIIHRPSMMNIANEKLRDRLQDFFLHESSVRSQWELLFGNFSKNMSLTSERLYSLDVLKDKFQGKSVIFVAGGPSLDDNIDVFAEWSREYVVTIYGQDGVSYYELSEYMEMIKGAAERDEYLVVCVGTVLKKMLSYGIKPDYVVMTDAQVNMMNQIAGVDTADLSLIYIPTLYYGVAHNWNGNLYVGLQAGFEPAEKLAAEQGRMLYETGGSVSTYALDFLIRFGCSKVVCVGLDLSFVDNKRHAGEAAMSDMKGEMLRKLQSVDGGEVYTSKNLDNYRMWIERRLANRTEEERKVRIINASRGALIAGMEHNKDYFADRA
ncbi:MAG: motility associated factor glycosyltransferase family protein [Lachnospira sp.]|nr:motility associated factor glycosyltransferase family protein [Lachnospira sp.]